MYTNQSPLKPLYISTYSKICVLSLLNLRLFFTPIISIPVNLIKSKPSLRPQVLSLAIDRLLPFP